MATSGKDTIYIDIDDEITTVIEKVRASDEKIVALVLPKRATVLQSIVNMKLLKRSADQAHKQVVLITSEAGLLPMAGAVGFYVARNLQTKPEIPSGPAAEADETAADEEDEVTDDMPADAGARPVGELAAAAGAPLAAAKAGDADAIETLELDDEPDAKPADAKDAAAPKAVKPPKLKKDHKLAIPNFDKFRLRIVLGVLLVIVLIVGLYLANVVLPKATIIVSTDTSDVNSSLTLNLDTDAKALDADKLVLPAVVQKVDKNGSQQVATTGKKNLGVAATGKITLSLPDCSVSQVTVPAGSGVSANGLTFITQADANLQSVKIGSNCQNAAFPAFSTASVNVTAQAAGSNYNIDATTFKVSGYPGVSASSSSAMSGGTDNIVQIVTQADIDSASQKINAQNGDSVKQQLEQQLKQAGKYPIATTFVAGTPSVTRSSQVGDQASTVTVTQTTSYTMFGVKESDLKTLVDNDVKDKIDSSKQTILNEGLDKATYRVNSIDGKTAQIALGTTATAGPDLKTDTIKTEVAGKKSGDIKSLLKQDPGVTKVDVHFSPFWVTHAPGKSDKITVTFIKATP
jgi:hypothetical protein